MLQNPFSFFRLSCLFAISFVLFVSCSDNSSGKNSALSSSLPSFDYLYQVPPAQPDGWTVAPVNREQQAEEFVSRVLGDTSLGVEGVLLSQEDALVLEEYKKGLPSDSLLPLKDSQLLLIATLSAVWQNKKGSLQEQMVSLNSSIYAGKSSVADTSVSLHHLLRMETDMLCRPQNLVFQEVDEKNDPARFYYCPANYEAVAQWMEHETDGSLSFFAEEQLFEPLRIDRYQWEAEEVSLQPRDMLKLAAVYARKGSWQQQQLFSDSWVRQLHEKAYDARAQGEFAWGWWQDRLLVEGRQYSIFYSKGPYYLLVYVPDVDAGILLSGQLNRSASVYFPLLQEQAIPALLKKS